MNTMNTHFFAGRSRSALSLGLFMALSTALAGCATTQEQLSQDYGTCESFGAQYGSSEYSQCMLVQQQRRDNETLRSLEEARLATELSRNSQEIIDSRRNRQDGY
ncbi:hypothetical protein ABIB57_002120 [Devosia sp. UYZn731]|uniref:hypothetical protein n=1 Tax=Devosia sp. UYZn731 TaxID=3156345 RepID=UPI00339A6BE8